MSGQELYDLLPENPVEVLATWREIREKIHDEFDGANEDQRVALLAVFKATMDIVEPTIAPEDLEKFRTARSQDYRLLLIKECLIGENVCAEILDAVTHREVAAGRMAADDELRKLAEAGAAAGVASRVQLIELERQKHAAPPVSLSSRVRGWFRGR